jgi:ribonuclease HI
LTEAEKFLNGDEGSATVPGNKFYAVKSGRAPGIYTDWPNVQKQITGWTKPDFRLFTTYAEALRFMGTESADPSTLPPGVTSDGTMLDQVLEAGHAVKKQKGERVSADTNALKVQRMVSDDRVRDGYEPGVQLPPGAEDGFDTNIILKKGTGEVVFKSNDQREATKPRSTGKTSGCMLRIYTDGSSLRNGQKGAFAGVGVYFGPLDSRCGAQ